MEMKPEGQAEKQIGIGSSAPPRVGESSGQLRTAAAWRGDQAEGAAGVGQEPTRRGKEGSAAEKLRAILRVKEKCSVAMGCHDAMGAKLIEEAGFEICFFSGFALSSSRLGMPDVGLATYSEMVDAGRAICDAVDMPVIGDGDTGYGSVLNVRRTVQGYARAGFAGITIEDQTFPKRCSYAKGVQVVAFDEAFERVKAALRARDELREKEGIDIVIIARTDSRKDQGLKDPLEEAKRRCTAFARLGADVAYAEGVEAGEMAALAELLRGMNTPCMVAQVEKEGQFQMCEKEAASLGFSILLRGVTLLNVYITSLRSALAAIRGGEQLRVDSRDGPLSSFGELYKAVGFEEAYAWEESS